MKTMRELSTLVVAGLSVSVLIASGCAMTYAEPTIQPSTVEAAIEGSVEELMSATQRILAREGLQVVSADEKSGVITTALAALKVTPDQADCGRTMGIDYLRDKRTETRVGYSVIITDGSVVVRANIEGQYKPGDVSQDLALTCVSRGILEQRIVSAIRDAME